MFPYSLLTAFFVVCSTIVGSEAAYSYHVDKYDLCDDIPNRVAKYSNMNIVGSSQAITISGTIEVLRSLQSPLQFELTLHRCEVDKTKCEHFDTIAFDDVCALYNENHLIRTYVGFFSPPLTCPIQTGTYVAKNGVLDMRAFEIFPIGDTHWQSEMRLIDASKQIVSCIRTETTITNKH